MWWEIFRRCGGRFLGSVVGVDLAEEVRDVARRSELSEDLVRFTSSRVQNWEPI